MEALCEAIAFVLAVSLIALGLRAGAVVALSIPLVLAAVFGGDDVRWESTFDELVGALVIALGLLVDDAMITVEAMVTRLEQATKKSRQQATFAYSSTAFPRLTGTLVTIAGFVPIGFASSAAGEYTFSIFAVVAIALIASWCVAAVFAPMLGVWILKKPNAVAGGTRPDHARVPQVSRLGDASPMVCGFGDTRVVRLGALRSALCSTAVLPFV